MDSLLKDIRYGIRGLAKRPGFTIVIVLTLALGIGANTAIFTLVNAVLLKNLPVGKPEELVLFGDATGEGTSRGDPPTGEWDLYSYDAYKYIRAHNDAFQDICAFRSGESRLSVSPAGSPNVHRAQGHLVTGNYFSLLGVQTILGRPLTPDDDQLNAPPAAVISYRYWKEQLGSDSAIVGKSMSINGVNFTVVGVTPEQFFGERVRKAPDFWVPLSFQPQIEMRKSSLEAKDTYWLTLMGRIKPGVSIQQAQTTSTLALKQFLTEQGGSQPNEDMQRAIQGSTAQLIPGGQGISNLRFNYSRPLQTLMGIVAMVLLIACANVGSLFLSRAAARKAEMSLRLALGASRFRIVRQLLIESLLLALAGGVGGVILAQWGVKLIVGMVTKETPLETQPDLLVLGFTAAVAILSGLIFGLLPAIRASRTDLAGAMKEKSRSGFGRWHLGLSSLLVVTQVCLSMVLLTGAGLFGRSLLKLQQEDVGFSHARVLLADVDPRLAGYKPAELSPLYERLLARLKAVPGVDSVSLSSYSPMSGTRSSSNITVQGYEPRPHENDVVAQVMVGPDFARTLGVPLLQGREVNERDNAAGRKVAVVNQAFVDHYFKKQSPLGHVFCFGDEFKQEESIEIVGVIGNIKSADARTDPLETLYTSIFQDDEPYSASFEVRSNGDPSRLGPVVRTAIAEVDPRLPILNVTTLSEQVNDTLKQDRMIAKLVSFFGLLALLLACIGLYAVMAHGVVRRTNEIGIRMALGAQRTNIVWLILRDTMILVLIGLAIGFPLALGSATLISKQLFGLKPADPLTLILAASLLTVVAMLAGYFPARRASRVNPLIALRYE
jgi:predicted permease